VSDEDKDKDVNNDELSTLAVVCAIPKPYRMPHLLRVYGTITLGSLITPSNID
jgi:hypothetical protein